MNSSFNSNHFPLNFITTKRGVNRLTDQRILTIFFARISDSEQNFNGFADPAIAAVSGFIDFLGPEFGFCL